MDLDAFPSQLEVYFKGDTSSSSFGVNPSDLVMDAIISLRFGWEIDNLVGTSSESYKYLQSLFQNSSPSFSSRETSSPSKLRDATNGVTNDSANPLSSELPSDKEEPKKKDSTD